MVLLELLLDLLFPTSRMLHLLLYSYILLLQISSSNFNPEIFFYPLPYKQPKAFTIFLKYICVGNVSNLLRDLIFKQVLCFQLRTLFILKYEDVYRNFNGGVRQILKGKKVERKYRMETVLIINNIINGSSI